MAIVVQTLVVIGIALFMRGMFHLVWGGRLDRLIGRILIALSAASFGIGTLGTLSLLR